MAPMGATLRRVQVSSPRRRGATLISALVGAAVLTGCSAHTDEPGGPTASAALEIELATGGRALSRPERDDLQRGVGDVLSAYVVNAFLGDYPRDDFVDSLDSFTSGAAADAAQDLDLLTARRYRDAEDVDAERLRARVSVFAAHHEAAGATARVRFRFAVRRDGASPTAFGMTGRFSLVPEAGKWRIFGYDIARDDPAAAMEVAP